VYFLLPQYPPPTPHSDLDKSQQSWNYQRIRISLSKPTAVTFADAPSVSVLVDSDPSKSQEVKELWSQRELAYSLRGGAKEMVVPFPLEGRLDEWIARTESGVGNEGVKGVEK
jgi:hypothetical protein